jgi:lipopolysaccharide export LptBFGC system permease protein LptF
MNKHNRIIFIIFLSVALAGMMLYLSGCSSIRKLKTNVKQTEQVKTTEQTTKAKDSSVTTVTKKIDSAGTTVTVVFDNDGKDTATNVEITTHPPTKDDYNTGRKIGVKTNRTPKSITVNQADKKADEQTVAANVKTNETKAATTDKQTTTVVKNKQVEKTGFQWWKIVLPIVIILIMLLVLWGAFGITPVALVRKVRSFFITDKRI